jgi:hypothetical protein
VLCGLLLALTASIASAAAGVNLRWSACFGDGGTANKTFACNSNTAGSSVLVGSFELGADLLQTSGVEIVVDVATAGATLPAWWDFKNPGSCRTASLVMNPTIAISAANCADWAAGGAAGGLAAYSVGGGGPNTSRMIGGFAIAVPLADLTGGQEYFAFNAIINNAKTVGTGSCAGCSTPACIVLNSIKCATPPVTGVPSRDVKLSGPTNGTDSNYATWQGGAGVNSNRGQGCPAATPTHKSTWQQVKTLYR